MRHWRADSCVGVSRLQSAFNSETRGIPGNVSSRTIESFGDLHSNEMSKRPRRDISSVFPFPSIKSICIQMKNCVAPIFTFSFSSFGGRRSLTSGIIRPRDVLA